MKLFTQKSINKLILNNMYKRISEATVSPENALDELIELDPETMLGQAMTDIMIHVANLGLLDYYLGYDRIENIITIYFSKDSKIESLKKLLSSIEDEIEKEPINNEQKIPLISANLYKSDIDSNEFTWILKLSMYLQEPDEKSNIPVNIDISGDIGVQDNQLEKENG
jgi:hypothetical protein